MKPEFETIAADLAGLLVKLCFQKLFSKLTPIFQQHPNHSPQARLFFDFQCTKMLNIFI